MEKSIYSHRLLARIVIEAETPIAVGGGESGILTDSLVATDINGLPYIPGTSIAGVLRHSIVDENFVNKYLGYQEDDFGQGSKIIISDAVMIGKEGKALDDLQEIDLEDEFYIHFSQLPIRQHVRINSQGTTDEGGKFDCQVVFKGTRFVFDVELVTTSQNDETDFITILKHLSQPEMRLGSGIHNGYGKIKVVDYKIKSLDLKKKEDLDSYINKSSCLAEEWPFTEDQKKPLDKEGGKKWISYNLELKPDSFFLFGSGLSDDNADMTPVDEWFIKWENGKPHFVEGTLIPASSIKGALSHRTAFYWNKLNHKYADKSEGVTGDKNDAVAAIFGRVVDSNKIEHGNILLSDVIIPKVPSKILNHVSIDRFTGGALDGALFTERITYSPKTIIPIEILVDSTAFCGKDKTIQDAFQKAIEDLGNGMLPLGGGVNRGHGIFKNY